MVTSAQFVKQIQIYHIINNQSNFQIQSSQLECSFWAIKSPVKYQFTNHLTFQNVANSPNQYIITNTLEPIMLIRHGRYANLSLLSGSFL